MFGVGAVMFEAILAVETAVSVGEVHLTHSARLTQHDAFYIRRSMYILFVFAMGAICVGICVANNYYEHVDVTGKSKRI